MLRLQQGVFPLERLQPTQLPGRPRRDVNPRRTASQDAVPYLFPPPRQHEGVNVQRRRHCLHLHPGTPLSFTAVSLNSLLYRWTFLGPIGLPIRLLPALARSVYFFEGGSHAVVAQG